MAWNRKVSRGLEWLGRREVDATGVEREAWYGLAGEVWQGTGERGIEWSGKAGEARMGLMRREMAGQCN